MFLWLRGLRLRAKGSFFSRVDEETWDVIREIGKWRLEVGDWRLEVGSWGWPGTVVEYR